MFLSTLMVVYLLLEAFTSLHNEVNLLALFFWMGAFRSRCTSMTGGWHRRLYTKILICDRPIRFAASMNSWISGVTISVLILFFNVPSLLYSTLCFFMDWTSFCLSESSFSIRRFEHLLYILVIIIRCEINHGCCLICYDCSHIVWQVILVIPTKPPLFFPVAFSHYVLWFAETSSRILEDVGTWKELALSGFISSLIVYYNDLVQAIKTVG